MKGATFELRDVLAIRVSFDPRSREGSDGLLRDNDLVDAVSIHAPVKGATRD